MANKRTAQAAMEVFLMLSGFEIHASVDEQENVMLALAAGEMDREAFSDGSNSALWSLAAIEFPG